VLLEGELPTGMRSILCSILIEGSKSKTMPVQPGMRSATNSETVLSVCSPSSLLVFLLTNGDRGWNPSGLAQYWHLPAPCVISVPSSTTFTFTAPRRPSFPQNDLSQPHINPATLLFSSVWVQFRYQPTLLACICCDIDHCFDLIVRLPSGS
jgi:hypothetical protein